MDPRTNWEPAKISNFTGARCFHNALHPITKKVSDTIIVQRACSCGGKCSTCKNKRLEDLGIQSSLKVNIPGDRWEREADHVANQVVRTPDSHTKTSIRQITSINNYPNGEKLRTKTARSLDLGEGIPLSEHDLQYYNSRFGANFSDVRIHDDHRADCIAQSLNARAFTFGNDIAFSQGHSDTSSQQGRHLMAHELTHVLQQQSSRKMLIQRAPLPRLEFEAVQYTVQREISELNDHIDQGRMEEAREMVPLILRQVSGSLAWDFALDAARAFFRAGMQEEALQALAAGRNERFNSVVRRGFSLEAVGLLFAEGDRLVAANLHEQAFDIYKEVFQWLEYRELAGNPYDHSDEPLSPAKELYPRLTQAMFSIPAHFRTLGDEQRATRYIQRINALITDSRLTDRYAIFTAESLIDLGDPEGAFSVLNSGREDAPSYGDLRWRYAMQVTETLLDSGERAVNAQQWDRAHEVFRIVRRWLGDPSNDLNNSLFSAFQRRSYVDEVTYRVMAGLFAIVDYHLRAAEDAHQNGTPTEARVSTARANAWIEQLERDFQGQLLQSATIALIEPNATGDGATYTDPSDPDIRLEVTRYSGALPTFRDRRRRNETILGVMKRQTAMVTAFYETDAAIATLFHDQHGHSPDIHNIEDRRLFWELKYQHLISGGADREAAVGALVESIGNYLQAYTIHSEYNVDDARRDVLTADFPRSTTRQALMDCGVYAMRTAHELSLIRNVAGLDFHLVLIPNHVYLAVVDRGLAFGWGLSNNQFLKIRSNIASDGVGLSVHRMFATLPSPAAIQQLGGLTAPEMVRDLNRPRPHEFRPPGYDTLRGLARRDADREAERLLAEYVSLKQRISHEDRAVSFVLLGLRRSFPPLLQEEDEATDGESGQRLTEWRVQAAERILARYQTYHDLSEATATFFIDAETVMGPSATLFNQVSSYFTNMFLSMRYVAYALGSTRAPDHALR